MGERIQVTYRIDIASPIECPKSVAFMFPVSARAPGSTEGTRLLLAGRHVVKFISTQLDYERAINSLIGRHPGRIFAKIVKTIFVD